MRYASLAFEFDDVGERGVVVRWNDMDAEAQRLLVAGKGLRA